MQATLRSTVAALALLTPLAATFVAVPVQAARATAAAAIETMTINSDAGLRPGATLRVRIAATPDARRASLVLGDSGITVPLTEQADGKYTGSYVIRRADRIDPRQLLTARLTVGDNTTTRQFNYPPSFQALADADAERPSQAGGDRQDREPLRDKRSPQITELTPANGKNTTERGRERVGARLADDGSGIDADSARLSLNGRDVTADARVSEDEIRYRGNLEPGPYTAQVSVRDKAGNRTTTTWHFQVAAQERGRDRGVDRDRDSDRSADRERERDRDADRVGSTAFPLQITSHADRAVVDANGDLHLRGRTLPFANVRVEVQSVASVAGVLGVTQPVADMTVQADRNGYFSVLVPQRAVAIPGTRYEVHVTASNGNRGAEERISLLQRD